MSGDIGVPVGNLDLDVPMEILDELLQRSPADFLDNPVTFDDLYLLQDYTPNQPSTESGHQNDTHQHQTNASSHPALGAASGLPRSTNDYHRMHLRAFYQELVLIGEEGKGLDIDQTGGAFIFHHKIKGIPQHVPPSVAPVLLPELPPGKAKSEKVTRITAKVLDDMTRGLFVQYHDGAIWTTRHCTSRVFYWTPQLNSTQSVKLDRDKQTKVFDFCAYFERLQKLAMTGHDFTQEKRPVVVFTFGQQWHGSSSNLKDIYVRIEITPLKAVEELNRVSRGNWDRQSIAVSISEEDIERSENGSVIMAPSLMLQGQFQHVPMSQ